MVDEKIYNALRFWVENLQPVKFWFGSFNSFPTLKESLTICHILQQKLETRQCSNQMFYIVSVSKSKISQRVVFQMKSSKMCQVLNQKI